MNFMRQSKFNNQKENQKLPADSVGLISRRLIVSAMNILNFRNKDILLVLLLFLMMF
jgi:hypothetical protein